MHREMDRGRRLMAAALAILLILPVSSSGAVEPADNGLASVTLYLAVCPAGYAGLTFFEDCYANPGAGASFLLERRDPSRPGMVFGRREATTGDDGLLAFEGIEESGDYLLHSADDPDRYHVGCTDESGARAYTSGPSFGGFWLDLTLDDELRCDWYSVPASPRAGTASLAVRLVTCPLTYVGESHASDCVRPYIVGMTYYLDDRTGRMETADASGRAVFDGLSPGRHTVVLDVRGHDLIDRRGVCTGASGGGANLPVLLRDGDNAECSIYLTFTELSGGAFGNLTIEHDRAGVPFVVTDLADGESVQVTTDRHGTSRFHLLPGRYALRDADARAGVAPTTHCFEGEAVIETTAIENDAGFALLIDVSRGDTRCVWSEPSRS
jgi:hypothetical protein